MSHPLQLPIQAYMLSKYTQHPLLSKKPDSRKALERGCVSWRSRYHTAAFRIQACAQLPRVASPPLRAARMSMAVSRFDGLPAVQISLCVGDHRVRVGKDGRPNPEERQHDTAQEVALRLADAAFAAVHQRRHRHLRGRFSVALQPPRALVTALRLIVAVC